MARVLIIDDEIFNLKILDEDLKDSGHLTVLAQDGQIGVNILKKDQDFDLILLDRMMPNLDGLAVMHYINSDPRINTIPVIMQTAAASPEQIREGMEMGVFYYLTKPFEKEKMLNIVNSALTQCEEHNRLTRNIIKGETALSLMQTSTFEFTTLNEARNLAALLANTFNEPDKMGIAIQEILFNAIEHGTLGISYDEKKHHLENSSWEKFLVEKMSNPNFGGKKAYLTFEKTSTEITITVKDDGDGFDFDDYDEVTTERLFDPNGRGILTAKTLFNNVTYRGNGNEVECVILL